MEWDPTKDDPVIAEVRSIRHQISAEFGHDMDRYFAQLIEEQEAYPHPLYRKGLVPVSEASPREPRRPPPA
ncbi:MAG: hypothetical protein HY720_15260 [Planctomycetes bacterium]|nr:hypothetical protein [Planctomycetota bacterium]